MRPEDEIAWARREEERGKKWLSDYYTKRELDDLFGKGNWKAMWSRAIWQA